MTGIPCHAYDTAKRSAGSLKNVSGGCFSVVVKTLLYLDAIIAVGMRVCVYLKIPLT